jgi:hypothetical protein
VVISQILLLVHQPHSSFRVLRLNLISRTPGVVVNTLRAALVLVLINALEVKGTQELTFPVRQFVLNSVDHALLLRLAIQNPLLLLPTMDQRERRSEYLAVSAEEVWFFGRPLKFLFNQLMLGRIRVCQLTGQSDHCIGLAWVVRVIIYVEAAAAGVYNVDDPVEPQAQSVFFLGGDEAFHFVYVVNYIERQY